MLKVILFIIWLISFALWIFFITEMSLNNNNNELRNKYCLYMWIACAVMNIANLLIQFIF